MNIPSAKTLNIILIPGCILVALLLFHRGCHHCTEAQMIHLTHDTIYREGPLIKINVPVPAPRRILPNKNEEYTIVMDDSSYSPYMQGYQDATEAYIKAKHTCRDTVYYNDTIVSPDNWRLVLLESITGNRLISRQPFIQDLRPVVTTTITNQLPAPKEHIRFYVGADASINATHPDRWGIGLSGLLTIPRGYGIRYGYDLRNNTHTAGVYVLVRIKK